MGYNQQFGFEKTKFPCKYTSGYKSNRDQPIDVIVADFERQLNILHKLFNCGTHYDVDFLIKANENCPAWVENFFANFDWRKIDSKYGKSVRVVLEKIKKTFKFPVSKNLLSVNNSLSYQYLRQEQKSVEALNKLHEMQNNPDILIVPAQLGRRYTLSSRRVREVMDVNEFGLGILDVGLMFLTHPERIMSSDDGWIICVGDEYARSGRKLFNNIYAACPALYFKNSGFDSENIYPDNDHFVLTSLLIHELVENTGVASGFLM